MGPIGNAIDIRFARDTWAEKSEQNRLRIWADGRRVGGGVEKRLARIDTLMVIRFGQLFDSKQKTNTY